MVIPIRDYHNTSYVLSGKNRICSHEEPCMERPSGSTDYDDLLECAVCNEILNNPRTLKCEHSFCKECVDNMTLFKENQITLTCPLCEEEQFIESGLCNMKPSLLLKQMLDRTIRYLFLNFGDSRSGPVCLGKILKTGIQKPSLLLKQMLDRTIRNLFLNFGDSRSGPVCLEKY